MAVIIDKRKSGKNKSANNRKKFMDRYKRVIKKAADKAIGEIDLEDLAKGKGVVVSGDTIKQPTFEHTQGSGSRDIVLPGNKEYDVGDSISKPQGKGGDRGSKGSPDAEDGEDSFTFTLTKEEFFEIYFKDMGLPNFIKESLKDNTKYKYKRAGHTKEGMPSRLNVKKTFESAIARRIATKGQGKKPRFLDDEDIRYNHYIKKPLPIRSAVMLCLMDVSGSMSEHHKIVAKKFFLLLYLFLTKEYEKIEIRFIRHTTEAQEVDQKEFFYARIDGGTVVASGLRLVKSIILKDIDTTKTNVYVAQVSDGDTWGPSDEEECKTLMEEILELVQYFAYIQVEAPSTKSHKLTYGWSDLYTTYEPIASLNHTLNIVRDVWEPSDVLAVLQKLFKKEV